MNSKKYLPTKTSKSSPRGRKPSKKSKASNKKLSVSSIEQSLNMTEVSIESQNETFTFQPNQASDDQESELEFIATSKSYIEEELTQELEFEIYEALKKRKSEQMSMKQHKICLEKSIAADEKSHESIEPPKKFKQTRNFQKCLEFQNKDKLNALTDQPSNKTPKKPNSKPSNIPPEKKTIKPVSFESEEEIFVPQKSQNIEPEVNPVNQVNPQNMTNKLEVNARPTKKLKTDKSNKIQPLIKFSVDIKFLNAREKVKKVVKFGNSEQIKRSSEALYVVEVEGSKEYKVLNNLEMTHFYTDALIDFYQGIIFD